MIHKTLLSLLRSLKDTRLVYCGTIFNFSQGKVASGDRWADLLELNESHFEDENVIENVADSSPFDSGYFLKDDGNEIWYYNNPYRYRELVFSKGAVSNPKSTVDKKLYVVEATAILSWLVEAANEDEAEQIVSEDPKHNVEITFNVHPSAREVTGEETYPINVHSYRIIHSRNAHNDVNSA